MIGCQIDTLLLIDSDISENEIRDKILSSNILYVGGGDTIKMMEIWKQKNVDQYLIEAYKNNIVLSGVSAGSICWFERGHSDSNSFENADGCWEYTKAKGIGLISAIHCPHYNESGRETFDDMMKSENIHGIALENNCAFVIKDNMYRIIKSDCNSKAYLLKNNAGKVSKNELIANEFSSIATIL
ncbi:Type 1 glutamine amidotransferase-like domain-containing protein [Inconstantimicrobium mannanitabidum]|nr:Type 1 glutamine amidotransferase-like domain-containing protein [Clostridium sp. TW13]